MEFPGWNSLESVKALDATVQLVAYSLWFLAWASEAMSGRWAGRWKSLFARMGLTFFGLAAGLGFIQWKYDARREALYDRRDAPRAISVEQEQQMLSALAAYKPQTISVINNPDLESQRYATQIMAVLRKAGWTIPPPPFRIIIRVDSGLLIGHAVQRQPEAVRMLYEAFQRAGIKSLGEKISDLHDDEVDLWVGPKDTVGSQN